MSDAAALASTVRVRLLAAPEVDCAGFRVTVRAVWSAATTSAVTVAPVEVDEDVVALLLDGLVDELDVDGLLEVDGLVEVDDEVLDDGLDDDADEDGLL